MGLKSLQTDALNKLCTKDQLDLLNSIDSLRSQGISHYVSLPQIIVCGDQSSGKSSVLEAISGVTFPIKSNLCTRFPTELVLRKTSHIGVEVSIVPHHSRSDSEKSSLGSFHEKLDGFEGLPTLIESAKVAMGILTHGKAFSNDLLRVEVSGPDRPHLTIVDLPGLVHSETKQQSASDVDLVKDVVQSYMKEPRSIILAVVSAKNDYANQIVLKLARAADKKGIRTLGVITKPDTLIAGSDSEAMYVSLARNQDVEFRLGWHVLRNMDSEAGDFSLAHRSVKEDEFFSAGIWKELSPSLLGIDTLRERLSKLLLRQIAVELPSLIEEIDTKFTACHTRLNQLGEPRATVAEQRLYLLHISQSFQSVVKAAVDGTYNDPFFGDALTEPGYQKRIRALMQNLNLEFAEHITRHGHRCEITDSKNTSRTPEGVIPTTRDEFMDHVGHLMRRTRGRELPGTFNPMIVADLFLEQSARWETITRNHIDKVWKAVKDFLSFAVIHVADAATSKALFQKIFETALDQLKGALTDKTTELLTPHQKSHPITYNHYFTETLQKTRNERSKDEYSKILQSFFGVSSIETPVYMNQHKDLRQLLANLLKRTEPDMNRFACSEALDCMEAYYKVALKRFIDDIAIEVIETKLISPLNDIFSPVVVSAMDADLVTSIAGESEERRALREQLSKQLEVLMKGSDTCKRFIGARIFDTIDDKVQFKYNFNNDPSDNESSDSSDGSKTSLQEEVGSPTDRSASSSKVVEREPEEVGLPTDRPASSYEEIEREPEVETFENEAIVIHDEPVSEYLDNWQLGPSKGKSKKSKGAGNAGYF